MAPYQTLLTLSQSYIINFSSLKERRKLVLEGELNLKEDLAFINMDKVNRVLEDLEMKNLPENHSIFER